MPSTKRNKSETSESLAIKGLGVSDGFAIGPVYVLHADNFRIHERTLKSEDEIAQETSRFQQALDVTREQLDQLIRDAKSKYGKEYSAILESHFLMLEDQEMIRGTLKNIKSVKMNAEAAFAAVMDKFKTGFLKSNNEYLRERANDLEDVKRRLLGNLLGQQRSFDIPEASVIVADTIKPSDIAGIDRNKILGFVSEAGSKLSHFSIVARSLNIPAIVGIANLTGIISKDDTLLLDGHTGELIINPDKKDIDRIKTKSRQIAKKETDLETVAKLPCVTGDGYEVSLCANVELPEEVENALHLGAQGIGLYRTEYMLFSARELPDEETQYREYRRIAEKNHPHKITMRTFDVGGDKIPLEILTAKGYVHEDNPFLGWRAIRIALEYPDFFIPQIRAMLRLSSEFNVEIMIPMVINLSEMREAKRIIEQCKQELRRQDIPFNENIPVGMMIETPGAAILAQEFAAEVDFFSIGTNDLVQYTLAVDRGNPKVSGLYNCFHPAILRLIKQTIAAGHQRKIHVAMCGEMASNPYAAILLLGMGLHEFSVLPPVLTKIKKIIRSVSKTEAEAFASEILVMSDVAEIEKKVSLRTKAILG
ncbi:MAG TPA: phosphoenolpyruvate--protein phosphotransferase [bacterium]|nr:phosphoenolpyruvate--protein phosphotransferase [bacterium]